MNWFLIALIIGIHVFILLFALRIIGKFLLKYKISDLKKEIIISIVGGLMASILISSISLIGNIINENSNNSFDLIEIGSIGVIFSIMAFIKTYLMRKLAKPSKT